MERLVQLLDRLPRGQAVLSVPKKMKMVNSLEKLRITTMPKHSMR